MADARPPLDFDPGSPPAPERPETCAERDQRLARIAFGVIIAEERFRAALRAEQAARDRAMLAWLLPDDHPGRM